MPTFNLGARSLTGRTTFQAQYLYDSDNDTLIIRKPDGSDFTHGRLVMTQDTSVASDKALLVATVTANPANVILGLDEELARILARVSGAEVMRFRPPAFIDNPSPPPAGQPRPEPPLPPPPPPAAAGPLPLPSVNLNALRAGGALANASDASVVYVSDAPNYSTGLYVRKAGSWLTTSSLLVSGMDI